MEINVRKIADLAALEVDKEKYPDFEVEFMDIIKMVSDLPECSEYDIIPEPMELRDDVVECGDISQSELLGNACEIVKNCFTAPQTVEY